MSVEVLKEDDVPSSVSDSGETSTRSEGGDDEDSSAAPQTEDGEEGKEEEGEGDSTTADSPLGYVSIVIGGGVGGLVLIAGIGLAIWLWPSCSQQRKERY